MDFFDVNIEQTNWQENSATLAAIRNEVFVREQQAPEDLELDGLDDSASHWLATAPDNTPVGTVRMLNDGQVQRLAVLSGYRNKGVASALLRKIIRHAQTLELDTLNVDAPIQLENFLKKFDFERQGENYEEDGIVKTKMVLHLARFYHPVPQPDLPEISTEDRMHQHFEGAGSFVEQAIKLLEKGERKVRILTQQMDPRVYDNSDLCHQIQRIATSHPEAQIRVLVRDNSIVRTRTVGLAELASRLGSNMAVRLINKHLDKMHNDFIVVDESGILKKQDELRYIGYSVAYAPLDARDLSTEFDHIWEHSLPDPESTRLSI